MQLLLDEIADVRMGLTLRGTDAAKRTVEEGPHYLRISDLSDSGQLDISETQPLDPALDPDHRHRVKAGDIVLANRGTRMTAALIPENLEAVASSQLFVIRPKSPKILPTFLHRFPQSPEHPGASPLPRTGHLRSDAFHLRPSLSADSSSALGNPTENRQPQ